MKEAYTVTELKQYAMAWSKRHQAEAYSALSSDDKAKWHYYLGKRDALDDMLIALSAGSLLPADE